MKKSTYNAIITGILSALVCITAGYNINMWQYWAISAPIIIISVAIHNKCKD
jgi:prolipoprotein diacylglyceryltransferase